MGFINAREQERQADELLEQLKLETIHGNDLLADLSTAQNSACR